MAEMLQKIQEKDEKLMYCQEQEERLQELEKELAGLLQSLPDTEELLMILVRCLFVTRQSNKV